MHIRTTIFKDELSSVRLFQDFSLLIRKSQPSNMFLQTFFLKSENLQRKKIFLPLSELIHFEWFSSTVKVLRLFLFPLPCTRLSIYVPASTETLAAIVTDFNDNFYCRVVFCSLLFDNTFPTTILSTNRLASNETNKGKNFSAFNFYFVLLHHHY